VVKHVLHVTADNIDDISPCDVFDIVSLNIKHSDKFVVNSTNTGVLSIGDREITE
jgi:hypothetical protein